MKHNFFMISLAGLLCMACSHGVQYNSNSGNDGTRDVAVLINVNQDITGDLSASKGDNEDWFYFIPSENQGSVTVSVITDSNSPMEATVELMDAMGRSLQSKQLKQTSNTYLLDKTEVEKDKYFVVLKTASSDGKYTFRVDYELPVVNPPDNTNEAEASDTEANTEETTDNTKTRSCVPADKCKPGQKCCKPKPADNNEAKTDNSASLDGAKTIKGTIVLNTPRGDGVSDIKINGLGKNNNVKPGAKAVLRGLNRKVDIYKVMNTSCMATVNATSDELKRYDTVEVVVE